MRLSRLLFVFVLATTPTLYAAACAPDLLSVYDVKGFTCDMGPFTVKDFSYSLIKSTVIIADTDITVTPVFGVSEYGLTFSSSKFSVTGSDSAQYLLGYTWDPGDIRGFLDFMDTDPPVFPGLAQVTTDLCEDAAFSPAPAPPCTTTTATLVVSDNGLTIKHSDSVDFSPSIGTVGVRNTIELDGNGASAVFTSFTNTVETPNTQATPEPSTWISGLLVLAFVRRRSTRFVA